MDRGRHRRKPPPQLHEPGNDQHCTKCNFIWFAPSIAYIKSSCTRLSNWQEASRDQEPVRTAAPDGFERRSSQPRLPRRRPLTPATSRKAVAFCCDHRYFAYALFAATQIAELHPDRDFDICICGAEEMAIPDTLRHLSIRSVTLIPGTTFSTFGLDARRSESAYHRLLLASQLGRDYDRILYLDSDIHVQGGDMSRLLDIELDDRPIAAVRDNPQWRTPTRLTKDFKALKLPYAPYFNSGVLVIDTHAWRLQEVEKRALAFGAQHGPRLKRHDQTLLNAVLRGHWAEISPMWNWQYSKTTRLHEALLSAHIVHFIGPSKPWNASDGALPPRFSFALTRFLNKYLPSHQPVPPAKGLDLGCSSVQFMLLRHILNRRKMARFLDGFSSDYASCNAKL